MLRQDSALLFCLPINSVTNLKHCQSQRPLQRLSQPTKVRRDLNSLPRMSVQEYIDKHELSRKVEEVINLCVKAKPDEPLSYMVQKPGMLIHDRYLTSGSMPVIVCCEGLCLIH